MRKFRYYWYASNETEILLNFDVLKNDLLILSDLCNRRQTRAYHVDDFQKTQYYIPSLTALQDLQNR